MNSILAYLTNHYQEFGLDRIGLPKQLSAAMITPRFHASSHVLFLIFPQGEAYPKLVVKTPRLAGVSDSIRREIDNLRLIQTSRPEGFNSIPKVIAIDEKDGRPLLIETALVGRPMDPAEVRRHPSSSCSAVMDWLVEAQTASKISSENEPNWFTDLVEVPLNYFSERFPLSMEEKILVDQTREIVAPLQNSNLPLVFEHGDLSHPNVMILKTKKVGVVDWEQANPKGQPGADLFFFLTYVAFALNKSHDNTTYLPAFQSAFFGHNAWARRYILDYAKRIGIPIGSLSPLFVLCWFRYMFGLLKRLSDAGTEGEQFGPDTAEWLRGNRYYALWQYSVTHEKEIAWVLN